MADRLSEPAESLAELAAKGVLHAGMAIVFGWVAHALELVGSDILAGRSGADTPEARTIDECAAHLHAAGWSVGESCFMSEAGVIWQEDGTDAVNSLLARAPTQAGAWRLAVEQAAAAGMLSR